MNNKDDNAKKSDAALREEEMLAYWREHDIFNKSLEKDAPNGDFVFYDGPPFATGLPHYGHILAGTIKDAIPRFWTMNGYRVRRKWGWDCHGLPLENIIEKRLGISTKREIEELGVKKFNEAARDAVMEYADDWRRIVPKMGRWVDMEDDYKTMDPGYTESVWWVFSELYKKSLVYEGFKSMHLCPRCGTTLSNFEVNQGYKDIKDISVTVELQLVDEPNTSLLVWTTTPWTLPGNMAAAVHNDHEYVTVEKKDEGIGENVRFILAKDRLQAVFGEEEYEIVDTYKGSKLVGKSYIPPFDYYKDMNIEGKEKAWKIYHAPYVEIGDEGTGAVHLAPAYGEDDMVLAKEYGIPIVHHVGEDGKFLEHITDLAGKLVKPKDDDAAGVTHLEVDIEILKKLKENGKLFEKENITHSYPHCWRCDTPLLNYATTSWFVEVTKFSDKLVKENKKVHWVPEHVGHARFGKWLEGARDWAISRQRYWGAPLPIWRNPETKEVKVFGSLQELQEHVPKSGNTYFTMRHGESVKNVEPQIVTDAPDAPYPLTDKGREDVKESASKLKGKIDLIITSPVLRAKETAEILASEWGFTDEQLIVDERIKETGHGVYEGKNLKEFFDAYPWGTSRFDQRPDDGETWADVKKRMGAFVYQLDETHKGKSILIVSHGAPLALMHSAMQGLSRDETWSMWEELYPHEKGVAVEMPFTPKPHNNEYELDFHRPYIDDIELVDTDSTKLERVPDVFDCWFESGSMPYAETHYPFENLDVANPEKGVRFPADFIAESVDQTRGWFYSLIVLGTALFGKSPYRNVITNGMVLAEDGKKMSKSLSNYPDPMELVAKLGADSMRYYLLSSPIIKGEDLNFSEKEVMELQRKNIGRLHNVLLMYETYADGEVASSASEHVLDRWILARLNELVHESTEGFKSYELDKATRPVTDFIDDLSVWYLRRSRDRLKGEDLEDKQAALGTLRHVLKTLALIMAPSMPFYSEYLWQRVKEEGVESVHLAAWPEENDIDKKLLEEMSEVRELISVALELRAKAGIKVRQPLQKLTTKEVSHEMQPLILDEVNVKALAFAEGEVQLDTAITPELKREGDVREFIRNVQDERKKMGLNPGDTITLKITENTNSMIGDFEDEVKRVTGTKEISIDSSITEIDRKERSFAIELSTKG